MSLGAAWAHGAVNHFTAELAKGRTWEEAAASYLEGLPTNLARAYAPFVAQTSGNAEALNELASAQGEIFDGH